MPERLNLLGMDRHDMAVFFSAQGEQRFRALQVTQWAHQRGVLDFQSMTDLSKPLRARLKAVAEFRMPVIRDEQISSDDTRKWLLELDSGNSIETVYIPEQDRSTLCVSSQVGCILDCSFCATAQQGFNRNLTPAEIIGQVWIAHQALGIWGEGGGRLSNVVFMGMGEPLYNYNNVLRAVSLLTDDLAYGLSKRRVTISTAGVVPAIERLADETDVSLAVSLHAPDDELRDELVPLNRRYPIAELLNVCKRYVSGHTRRKVTFEYVMLKGVNDSDRQAQQLAKLLRNVPAKINLIPFNPFPGSKYECSPPDTINQFGKLLHEHGLVTTMRKTRGRDIAAACGQLAGRVKDRTHRHK